MKRRLAIVAILLVVAAAVYASGGQEMGRPLQPISSDECPESARGDLDVLYCDKDGDLIADLPDDEQYWQNPDTLVFAYVPVEDPAIYEDIWQPFLDHLSEVTGREVQFFAIDSYTAQVEAMRAGRLHVAGYSTGTTPFAVNLAGFRPFTIMGEEGGRFGYTLQLFVQADSDIEELSDLEGRRVAHVSETSNSGHQAPSALFTAQGVEPGEDYDIEFSGSHENSALGVVQGDYDAAPVASEVVERMADRGLYDPDEVRIIYESDPFPTTAFGTSHNLHPDLQEKVEEAFMSFDFEGTALGDEFDGVTGFIPITYEKEWSIIREIQETNGVVYSLADID